MEVPHSVAQERDPPAFVFRLLSFVLPTKAKGPMTMKRLAIIGCMAALGVFAEVPEDWTGTTHDLTTGALTAADGGAYWVTGSGSVIVVPDNVVCTVALDTVTIATPAGTNPFTIGAGSTARWRSTR